MPLFVAQGRAILRRDVYVHVDIDPSQLQYAIWDPSFARPSRSKESASVFTVSPPQIVGLSNGVAQSIVSLARGFGPLLGGYVRALSLRMLRLLIRLPFSYGPQRCKGTRRDTTSGSS